MKGQHRGRQWRARRPGPGDARHCRQQTDHRHQGPFGGGEKVLASHKDTGALLWSTTLDTHPAAIITQSATVFGNRVYVGTSSLEESFALIPNYPCCSFPGTMAALDLNTGAIVWQLSTAPPGFPGNAVWGSSPAIDARRGQLYIATGNNYDAPQETLDCIAAAGNDPDAHRACLPADNHFDSVLALDLKPGAIRWVTRALGFDAWTVDCIPFLGEGDNCPEPAGPTSTSARRRRCSRSGMATGPETSSGPARRPASTGHSTPTPGRSCG